MRLHKVTKVITCSVLFTCLVFPISTNGAFLLGEQHKIQTVVIDAGHGGHDSGCIGHTNSNEKHIALKVALSLGNYIEEYLPDVKVIYTRKTDVFVDLEERAAIANRNNADLFISIHCNAASAAAFGTETFVMGLHKSEGHLNVAKRENSVVELEENHNERYGLDFNAPEAYIMLTMTQNAYLEQSTEFAALVQQQFRERVGRHDRGVKSAGFWVLWRTAMPSVLIETGFLTNGKEEAFLKSSQGQDYMASAIFRAFRQYKQGVEKTMTTLDEIERDTPIADNHDQDIPETQRPFSDSTSYRVQLLVSSKEYDSFGKKFRKVDNLIVEHLNNDLYRYSAGPYSSREAAARRSSDLKEFGFTDAFITVYEGGERVQILKNDEKQ